jgi:hypothetical protein
MGEMPEALPAADLPARFERRIAPRPSAPRWAWGAVAVLVGVLSFVAGRYTAPRTEADIASLRGEVRSLREVVALSLLDQQSASERLRGIRYSAALEGTDPEVVDALSRTLSNDSSVDVRLAAAEALRRLPLPVAARESAWKLLEQDDSPLVQIAVIDLLAAGKAPGARARLEKLRDRAGLDANVRDYLQALLSNQRKQGNQYQ